MEPNYTSESPIRSSLDSTAQTGHANGADWQEETYQKIKTMKDLYLPEISEMYQKIATKLQQHESLPQQSKSEPLEKLKVFKTMLERIITFLQVSKNNISPGYKEKFGSYEKQILNFINVNRPKMPALQQGQLPVPHMQSMLSHENKEWDQCKEVICTLNKELTDTQAKLKEESRLREEAEKAKTNLTTELKALREQMDKAKADAVAEFRVSQPFFDACGVYYGDGFNDCLKQVGVAYPDLNLSQIAIDYTIPPTPGGGGAVAASSIVDHSAGNGSSAVDPAAPNAPLS